MTVVPVQPSPPRNAFARRNRRLRAGFSFTEILFAVMILGIGFIMVAAMFPVAIKQTEEAVEDVTAANLGQEAERIIAALSSNGLVFRYLKPAAAAAGATATQIANTQMQLVPNSNSSSACMLMPPTFSPGGTLATAIVPAVGGASIAPTVTAVQNPNAYASFWQFCAGNAISVIDSRFAWTAVYSRPSTNPPTPFSQISIFCLYNRNTSNFNSVNPQAPGPPQPNDLWPYQDTLNSTDGYVANYYANLQARYCLAAFWPNPGGPDYVTFLPDKPAAMNNTNQNLNYDSTATSPTAGKYFPYYNTPLAGNNSQETAIVNSIAEGSYIIIADDYAVANQAPWNASVNSNTAYISCNGYCYRVGANASQTTLPTACNLGVLGGSVFAMMPGGDMKGQRFAPYAPKTNGNSAAMLVRVLVVGRGWGDPAENAYPVNTVTPEGNPMDLALFTTFVPTRN